MVGIDLDSEGFGILPHTTDGHFGLLDDFSRTHSSASRISWGAAVLGFGIERIDEYPVVRLHF